MTTTTPDIGTKVSTAGELRRAYIDFFKKYDHAEINTAPLIPENDPTVLFTTAGMHPLVPFLLGEKHPSGNRLVNCQKCVRTGDIDEVGDTCHLTFFEMLGNWSLGEYFKDEAIAMSFEFLTSELGIPVERIWISCFAGDEDAPRDTEAAEAWKSHGIPEERIVYFDKSENWWGPAGQTGPCGPDTEMFIQLDEPDCSDNCGPGCNCGKYVEIWNDVFMQYNKSEDGSYTPLQQKNVDTGMGLERMVAVLQSKTSPYETELFSAIFDKISDLCGKEQLHENTSARIVAEHMRTVSFIMADGVPPGNVDHGYIVRRLIRRAVREGQKLGIEDIFTKSVAEAVIQDYSSVYPELQQNRDFILDELEKEEKQFAETLSKGMKEFRKLMDSIPDHVQNKTISGRKAFFLYETYGFPLELTQAMATENGFSVDVDGFYEAFRKHQEQSRAGAQQRFKGGLADNSEITAQLHTATHLLHAALREVLGDHVQQAGSNITAERLRFDFTHPEKMTSEQIAEVERIVNENIQADLPVETEEMSLEKANERGVTGIFEDRYGDTVKVYHVGDASTEICGGPHAKRSGELGAFRIKKESSSSRGVRRIRAVIE